MAGCTRPPAAPARPPARPTSLLRYWKNVPFAESTAGANRFKAPVPVQPWSDVLNCTELGPGCISTNHNADTAPVQSEDCLNLNVFVPLTASLRGAAPLPVMFFM